MTIGAALVAAGLTVGACSEPDERSRPVTTGPEPTVPEPTVPATTVPPPPPPPAPPPETGVPGLDSDDVFCAAWSRYAGSFQVIAVASSFLIDDPRRAFELEVAGSHTVVNAYAELLEHWPRELTDERATAEQVFGPLATREADTASVLEAAGATPADLAAIDAAWLTALANRNPESPDVDLALDGPLADLVGAAADTMYNSRGPLHHDPTLITEIEPVRTYEYLARTCPDEGLLAGVDGT